MVSVKGGGDVVSLVNYPAQKNTVTDFLLNYEADLPNPDSIRGKGKVKAKVTTWKPYLDKIHRVASGEESAVEIKIDDILHHLNYQGSFPPSRSEKHAGLLNTFLYNGHRALRILYDAFESIIEDQVVLNCQTTVSDPRARVWQTIRADKTIPTIYRVPYTLHLIPPSNLNPVPLYELRGTHIGQTLEIRGLVSRVGITRPCMQVAVYKCEDCGQMRYQQIDTVSFVPLKNCGAERCMRSKKKDTLQLSMKDSKFTKHQEVWVQELPHVVPSGKIPQMLKLVVQGDLTDKIRPGAPLRIGGFYITEWETGWRPMRGGSASHQRPIFDVQFVEDVSNNYIDQADVKLKAEEAMRNYKGHALYKLMAASIAPTIYGHDDVKKAILLQMVGGTDFNTPGLKLRGSLHILLVGDPGIAKSQMLLRMCNVALRSKYTCGKGATGVGLTACVVKDPSTNEFSLEAGATVLADKGLCCIDEFDKMNERDRTAIHEVMEQQTVSISKAGIVATLNARASILAAANPIGGRYDIKKSAIANVGLPAALLSRFDMIFLLLDECNSEERDVEMARHLLNLHKSQKLTVEAGDFPGRLEPNVIKYLVEKCKSYQPMLPPDLSDRVVDYYIAARTENNKTGNFMDEHAYVTPRSLMGILRLAQALARSRFDNLINDDDLNEAIRISAACKQSVAHKVQEIADANIDPRQKKAVKFIKMLLRGNDSWIEFDHAINEGDGEGLRPGDIEEAIETLVAGCSVMWDGPKKSKFRGL